MTFQNSFDSDALALTPEQFKPIENEYLEMLPFALTMRVQTRHH